MKAKASDWYKTIWTLDIKLQSWVEDTAAQVDFLLRHLQLPRGARILDLACGFGRHALLLAQQGFSVVGADITTDYVADAQKSAAVMPVIGEGDPTRLYTQAEIQEIWRTRHMRLDAAFAGFTDAPANPDAMQMVVFSTKL